MKIPTEGPFCYAGTHIYKHYVNLSPHIEHCREPNVQANSVSFILQSNYYYYHIRIYGTNEDAHIIFLFFSKLDLILPTTFTVTFSILLCYSEYLQ